MLRSCDLFHATFPEEAAEIRARGYRSVPVATIPNGIDVPPIRKKQSPSRPRATRRMVFLSRIHPTKQVDLLLRCWKRVAATREAWELVIYGPEDRDGYRARMMEWAKREGPAEGFLSGSGLRRGQVGRALRRGPVRAAEPFGELWRGGGRGAGLSDPVHRDPRCAVGWS